MPDTKITALAAITTVDPAADVLPIVDISDTSMAASGTTKKITSNQILGAGGTATLASATITGALGAAGLNVTGSTIPANGVYLGSANNLSFSAASTLGMTLNATGLGVGTSPTGYGILALKKDNTSAPPYIVLDNRGTGGTDTNTYTQGGILFGAFRDVSNPAYIASITVERKSAAGGASSTGDLIFGTASTPTNGVATERLRIDSTGNVGIGVAPSAWTGIGPALEMPYGSISGYLTGYMYIAQNAFWQSAWKYKNTAAASYYQQQSGQHLWFTAPSGTAGNAITFTQAMTLDASGRLLVGVTSALASGNTFQNLGSARQVLTLKGDDQTSYTLGVWSASATGDNLFQYFATETTLTVRGGISYNRGGGLVAYNTTSDYRAKDIIGPVSNSGSLIDSLKVYVGKMKGATIERPMLIAHEAQEVAPYAVTGTKDEVDADGNPKYQQMDVSALVPVLIAEIQSLRARVQTLEAK